jgi:hypothetical protein
MPQPPTIMRLSRHVVRRSPIYGRSRVACPPRTSEGASLFRPTLPGCCVRRSEKRSAFRRRHELLVKEALNKPSFTRRRESSLVGWARRARRATTVLLGTACPTYVLNSPSWFGVLATTGQRFQSSPASALTASDRASAPTVVSSKSTPLVSIATSAMVLSKSA